MLALFSSFGRWLRASGVRALKQECSAVDLDACQKHAVVKRLGRNGQAAMADLDQASVRQPAQLNPAAFVVSLEKLHHPHDIHPARARRQGPVRTMVLKSAKLTAAFAFSALCYGQGSITLYQAIAPTSQSFNNTNPRYNAWTVMYSYSGSGSFSIELDCAPDATTPGGTPTPGSYAACTPTTGSNPQTTPQYGYMTFVGYQTSLGSAPWLKLNLTAISSGNLTAFAMGFQAADPESGTGGGGGCPGSLASPCVIAGTNGMAKQTVQVGTTRTNVTLSTATDAVLVSGTSGKKTYLTKLQLSWDNSATVTYRQGTTVSTACDTSTAALSGGQANLVALFDDFGSDFSYLTTSATGLDICIHYSTAVTGGGYVFSNQF